MKPVPKNVISVPPLEGTRAGLKYEGEKGAKMTKISSLAKILVNFLLSVPSVSLTGPLSEVF